MSVFECRINLQDRVLNTFFLAFFFFSQFLAWFSLANKMIYKKRLCWLIQLSLICCRYLWNIVYCLNFKRRYARNRGRGLPIIWGFRLIFIDLRLLFIPDHVSKWPWRILNKWAFFIYRGTFQSGARKGLVDFHLLHVLFPVLYKEVCDLSLLNLWLEKSFEVQAPISVVSFSLRRFLMMCSAIFILILTFFMILFLILRSLLYNINSLTLHCEAKSVSHGPHVFRICWLTRRCV